MENNDKIAYGTLEKDSFGSECKLIKLFPYFNQPMHVFIGSCENEDVIIRFKDSELKISELLTELTELRQMKDEFAELKEKVNALWYMPNSIGYKEAKESFESELP